MGGELIGTALSSGIAADARRRTFHTLDALRGVAAILVATRHSGDLVKNTLFPESFLAVDLFFLLSGVVVAHSYAARLTSGLAPWRFMLIRIVRLYPLYILGISLGLFQIAASYASHSPKAPTPLGAITGVMLALFMLPPGQCPPIIIPRWSLSFEMIINAIYAATIGWMSSTVLWVIIACAGAGLFYNGWQYRGYDIGFQPGLFYVGILRVTFSFFVGVLMQRLFSYNMKQRSVAAWLCIVGVALLLAIRLPPTATVWYEATAIILLFPLIVWTSMHFDVGAKTARAFAFLGTTSYAVYVIHQPLALVVEGILKRISPAGQGRLSLLAASGYMATLVVLSWGLDRWYDGPVRKKLSYRLGLSKVRRQ